MSTSSSTDTPKRRKRRCYYVYLVEAADGRLYVGYTTDLARRMTAHRSARGSKFLRGFGFGRLRYHETHRTKSRALRREAAIKRLPRVEKLALCRCGHNNGHSTGTTAL